MLIVAPFSDDSVNGTSVPTLQLTVLPESEQTTGLDEHLNLLFTNEQSTLVPEAFRNSVLLGRRSVTVTPTAFAGPKAATPML
jgi:hypothetical protein